MSDQSDFYSGEAISALAASLGVASNQIRAQSVSRQLAPHQPGSVDIEPVYEYTITLACGGQVYRYIGLGGNVSRA
jgi:hypothetical protein